MDEFPKLTDFHPVTPPSLLHHSLRLIPDPRDQRRPKHALPDLLFVSLCSLLTGGHSFQDMADFARDKAAWLCTVIPFQGSRRGQPGALHMAATVNLWSIEEGLSLAWRRIPEASG